LSGTRMMAIFSGSTTRGIPAHPISVTPSYPDK
jgi:hypothetical protein